MWTIITKFGHTDNMFKHVGIRIKTSRGTLKHISRCADLLTRFIMALRDVLPLQDNFSGEYNFDVSFPNKDNITKAVPYCVTTLLLPL
jgi:hypothetical protein